MIKGRCLCGDVTYTLTSDLLFLYHCHCAECRRFSGSSNATNATIVGADLTIDDPHGKLTKYDLAQGGRYFCSKCGSPIYSSADDGEFPSLHCGTIIDPPHKELDANLLDAAADLGANPQRTFIDITLPLSLPGIIAGCMLVFIPAMGEFVIPSLLGGSDSLMIGRVLYDEFFFNNDWPLASAIALVLLTLLIVPIMILRHYQGKEAVS